MKKLLAIVSLSIVSLFSAQQKTYCNPINIDYGYTPFEVFSKQGKHRATADPVIVNFQKKLVIINPCKLLRLYVIIILIMQWSKILRPISLYGGIMVMARMNISSQEQTEQTLIIFKLRLLMRTESLIERRL